jgi:hypothetical protein
MPAPRPVADNLSLLITAVLSARLLWSGADPREQGMKIVRQLLLPAVIVVLAGPATAQTIVINPNKSGVTPPAAAEPVRISLGISMFMPAPADDGAQALKAQQDGRRLVYEAAAGECEILRATIARDCTLEAININVQRVNANQNFAKRDEGFTITGNMNYRIVAK